MPDSELFLGIDIGTSGTRAAVVDDHDRVIAASQESMPAPQRIENRPCQDPNLWWAAVSQCLKKLGNELRVINRRMEDIAALAVDGTSGTMLLTDSALVPLTPGYMYNSARFDEQANLIERYAPESSMARGSGSGLARMLFLQSQVKNAAHLMHQADWIAAKLMGQGGFSDETNVLKTGYDLMACGWPDWFQDCGVWMNCLPSVKPVGEGFGAVGESSVREFGFAPQTRVIAGTTDSNAAFLASGASNVGEGVTSLGTTLAIKLLSDKPVNDPTRGIYSHRIGSMWLPGGASNSGGGVLLEHFTKEQLSELERSLQPHAATGLDYYPLSSPGERFPINDPTFAGRLEPRPESDAVFFQAMLEGISEIERIGYDALGELGAPKLRKVFTAGGGATNDAWTQIRVQKLGVPIATARSADAAVGTARIAAGL